MSAEPVIRDLLAHFGRGLFQPADPRTRSTIEIGNMGLDVQQGRAVEDIDVRDMQMGSFDANEPDKRQTDGIGSVRRAGRKQAARLGVQERGDRQGIGLRPVKMIQQKDVGKPLHVLKTCREFGKYVDAPGGAVFTDRLDGHGLRFLEGAVNDADRFQHDGHGQHAS